MSEYYRTDFDKKPKPPQIPPWISPLTFVVFAVFSALMAFPNIFAEAPPPGVELYQKGNLVCWDKVVCCDSSDESTCERIPICRN